MTGKHLLVFNKEDFSAWTNLEKDYCPYIKTKDVNCSSGSVSRDSDSFKMLVAFGRTYWGLPSMSCQITTSEYSKKFNPNIYGM